MGKGECKLWDTMMKMKNRFIDRPGKRKKGRFFLTSLIGAIIGALLVILAVPTLSNYGLLPYSVQPTNRSPSAGK